MKKPTSPIAIHAEVTVNSIITDFDDGSFTQEFFKPEIKSLAPPNPNPFPLGRWTNNQHNTEYRTV